ncbi:MAG: hypothetical protein DWQ40_00965 [Actinobacteria bacterium]|nr:MAG: hypothetical protein DWQ40_00965 [Actinomycetota bacterium]
MQQKMETIRIPESRVRVTLAILTPPLLLGMALLTLAVESPIAVPIVFGILGTLLGIVVIFDFPLAVDLTDLGLVRVCLARRHQVRWENVAAIIKPKRRGLVLVTTARKRHVLIDRILEPSERTALMSIGDEHDIQVEL